MKEPRPPRFQVIEGGKGKKASTEEDFPIDDDTIDLDRINRSDIGRAILEINELKAQYGLYFSEESSDDAANVSSVENASLGEVASVLRDTVKEIKQNISDAKYFNEDVSTRLNSFIKDHQMFRLYLQKALKMQQDEMK